MGWCVRACMCNRRHVHKSLTAVQISRFAPVRWVRHRWFAWYSAKPQTNTHRSPEPRARPLRRLRGTVGAARQLEGTPSTAGKDRAEMMELLEYLMESCPPTVLHGTLNLARLRRRTVPGARPSCEASGPSRRTRTQPPLLPTDKPNHLLGIADEESPEQASAAAPLGRGRASLSAGRKD
jgi:hypothetical protein